MTWSLKFKGFADGTNPTTNDQTSNFKTNMPKTKTNQIAIKPNTNTTLEIDPNNNNTKLAKSVGKGQVSTLPS